MKKIVICSIVTTFLVGIALILYNVYAYNQSIDRKKWHENNRVVAHAMGGIDGKMYTNSLEAFENAYQQGVRVFEVDFAYTADNEIVLCHNWRDANPIAYTADLTEQWGWDTAPSYDEYMHSKILYKYTPLSLGDMLLLLKEYRDCYFVTDSKYPDKEHIQDEFSRLFDLAKQLNATDVLQRIIVQIYNDDMYFYVKEIYPFENWIYTIYALPSIDLDAISQFCQQNGIDVITASEGWAKTVWADKVHSYGIKYYVYTINSINDAKYADSVGVDGIYSDYLVPGDYDLF